MSDPKRWLDPASDASPATRALLAAARGRDEPPAERLAAVAARLAVVVAPLGPVVPGAPGGPAAPAAPAPAIIAGHAVGAKLGAALVALGLVGGGAWYLRASDRSAPGAPSAREAPRPAASSAAPPAVAAPAVESPASAEAPAVPGPAPQRPPGSIERLADRAGEAALVHAADAALRRGDAGGALTLAGEHARRFPAGAHAEERERIAIEALVRLGRSGQARAAAERFLARHPASIYRARIEELVR
jgi:hypothetical protein